MAYQSRDTGHLCDCVADHHPEPLVLEEHHIWPLGMGGPDIPENLVWVCPSTHGNAHEVLRTLVAWGPISYRSVCELNDRGPVPRYAYALAREGYRRWQTGSCEEPAAA